MSARIALITGLSAILLAAFAPAALACPQARPAAPHLPHDVHDMVIGAGPLVVEGAGPLVGAGPLAAPVPSPHATVPLELEPPLPQRAADPPRSDHVLFTLLAIGLGFLWAWYRRDPTPEGKIRLAALAALVSVVFLSVTAAMPWLGLGEAGAHPIRCLLGQEGECVFRAGSAVVAASGGHDQLASLSAEMQRWQCASAALRMGQVTAMALLLPALIWLLVEPRQRAAQAATAVGASVGGFTFLVVLLYQHSVPAALGATLYWTADIALVTAGTIVVAAVLIVRQSFAQIAQSHRLPRAFIAPSRRR